MKAILCTKYGPPEVLTLQDLPKPTPKANEILIKIMASAVNSGDVRVRGLRVDGIMKPIMRLVLGFNKPRKAILGTVFSGVVEAVCSSVSKFKIGDEVYGLTGMQFGTYAEYIAVSEKSKVILKPTNATHEEAAAILFGGQTAIYFLEKAGIKERENPEVLIIGATGSVGTAAVQIAQQYTSNITAVCSSKGVDLVNELGVSNIIQYDKEDFSQHKTQYDIVFDAVGKANKKHCKTLLKNGGSFKSVEGFDVAAETIEQLEILKSLFEKGQYKATIDKVYPLAEIVEAHRYVDKGRKKGNVVLRIG